MMIIIRMKRKYFFIYGKKKHAWSIRKAPSYKHGTSRQTFKHHFNYYLRFRFRIEHINMLRERHCCDNRRIWNTYGFTVTYGVWPLCLWWGHPSNMDEVTCIHDSTSLEFRYAQLGMQNKARQFLFVSFILYVTRRIFLWSFSRFLR